MAAGKRDYYEVLGVGRDADPKAIKDAFRNLALKYHPDRNKTDGAEERFKEIAEAYAVLSNPQRREQYDRGGFAGVGSVAPEDLFADLNLGDLFGVAGPFGFDLGGDLFGSLFRRRPRGPVKGADIQMRISVPLDVIHAGGAHTVRFSHPAACDDCGGSGAAKGTEPKPCGECEGRGQNVVRKGGRRGQQNVVVQQVSTCPKCHGRGTLIAKPCVRCAGAGRVDTEEQLELKIPPGAPEGLGLRVPGRGMPSDDPRGAPGDFYAIVHSELDTRFERADADLWRTETIDVPDAVLGTRVRVPSLEGSLDVTVPPGAQPGEVLRLRGQGLPHFRGHGRGDLHVRLDVHVPTQPSEQERALYEQLRALSD